MDALLARLRRLRPAADPDGPLLARYAATGDEAAFAELVRRHGPLVWAAARRRLPDPADAADVFQATFLVLARKGPRLAGHPTVGPWLYRVAALTARNLRRRNAVRATSPADATLAARPEPDPSLRWDLDDALLALGERDRAAVVLCHLEGYTRREAAERLGLPEGTLSAVLHRALKKLRARLGDPLPVLAAAGAAVPAGLAAATCQAAAVARVAALSGVAGPVVVQLTRETLRMFWLKRLLAGGMAAAVCVGLGVGVGLAPRPAAVADPPKAEPPAQPAAKQPPGDTLLSVYTSNWPEAERALYQYRIQEDVLHGSSFDYGVSSRGPSLQQFLLRAATRADPPKWVYLYAGPPGRSPEAIRPAVRALLAAGFPEVSYTGPVPGRWEDDKLADGQPVTAWQDVTRVERKVIDLRAAFPPTTARWDRNHPLTYQLYVAEGGGASLRGTFPWRPGLTARTAAAAAPELAGQVEGASVQVQRFPLDAIGDLLVLDAGPVARGAPRTLDALEVRPDDRVFLTPAERK